MVAPNWSWKEGMASMLPMRAPSKPPMVEPRNMKPQLMYSCIILLLLFLMGSSCWTTSRAATPRWCTRTSTASVGCSTWSESTSCLPWAVAMTAQDYIGDSVEQKLQGEWVCDLHDMGPP